MVSVEFASHWHVTVTAHVRVLKSMLVTGFVFGSAINLTSPSCSKEVIPSVCTPNRCKQVHVLAEFNVSFIYRDSFDVSHESEQMKLRRFLYFIKGE
jgi:hypothetical protein